jgi:tetratricopeptide (TPR) repeat protein
MPSVLRRLIVLMVLLAPSLLALPAQAEWREARTDRFVVYSEGSEADLRARVITLHRFDRLVRAPFGLSDTPPVRPLTVFLLTGRDGMEAIYPDVPENIGGWYSATEHEVYAALNRRSSGNSLLHEFVHHTTLQNFPAATPAWFTEGIAMFYATAQIDDRETRVGYRDEGRVDVLNNLPWMPLDRLLTRRALTGTRQQTATFYAQAWLLTHYLLSDPQRLQGLTAYLKAVSEGVAPLDAVQPAFGMTPAELDQELRRYYRGRIPYRVYPTPPMDEVAMTVRTLPPSADDVFPLFQRLNYGQRGDDGPRTLARIRAAAERWPDDRLAVFTLAKAEIAWGTPEAAEAALNRLLAADPADVDVLRWMARLRMTAATRAPDGETRERLNRQARAFLARALNADPDDYRIYLALGRSRRSAPDYPTENDLRTWASAVELAPQVATVRGESAEVFARAGHVDAAVALLLPLANDPHGGARAARARRLIQTLRPDAEAPDQPETIEDGPDETAPPADAADVAPGPDAG